MQNSVGRLDTTCKTQAQNIIKTDIVLWCELETFVSAEGCNEALDVLQGTELLE